MLRTHAAAARTPGRLRRKALIGVATLSIAAASTATALAGADHYFSGTLVSGRGWAGTEAHSVTYIEGERGHQRLLRRQGPGQHRLRVGDEVGLGHARLREHRRLRRRATRTAAAATTAGSTTRPAGSMIIATATHTSY